MNSSETFVKCMRPLKQPPSKVSSETSSIDIVAVQCKYVWWNVLYCNYSNCTIHGPAFNKTGNGSYVLYSIAQVRKYKQAYKPMQAIYCMV